MTAWPIFHKLCIVYRSEATGGEIARLLRVKHAGTMAYETRESLVRPSDSLRGSKGRTKSERFALLPAKHNTRVRNECFWYKVLFSIKGSIWLLVRPLLLMV
jgi:hypothetical protein